ncbi:MAG: hypothetical protein WCF67_08410 [Chitinophagaceae bacterium]
MKFRFDLPTVFAFLALMFVCHELHEISHTATARLQCGCWGQRDFNAWDVCKACAAGVNSIWATIAGPLLTYDLIWTGFLLMRRNSSPAYRSLGWMLILANKPFARLFTVLMRGGDESVITRYVFQQEKLSAITWIAEIFIVLLLIVPPLVRIWRSMDKHYRTALFICFLLLPMLIEFALMHKLGNSLLEKGFLHQAGVLGSPLLVNIWTGVWVIILLLTWKRKSLGH